MNIEWAEKALIFLSRFHREFFEMLRANKSHIINSLLAVEAQSLNPWKFNNVSQWLYSSW